ncbi:MAG: NAD(P)H-dependent oxidoreductase [Chloroflexi bacterium]|nr:NAD(P)H-dependent oxidoreductase [Chloroflexota bacterium]
MIVAGISGSSAHSRRTRALIELALEGAREAGAGETPLIDLAEAPVEFADGRKPEQYGAATQRVLADLERSGAYVIGTPMYRGGMTGALKNLIDLTPKEYMRGKAAALIATGASLHHYLGTDVGLRTAMAFFQVHVVPAILYGAQFAIEDGRVQDEKLAEQARQLGRDVVELAQATAGKALGPAIEGS